MQEINVGGERRPKSMESTQKGQVEGKKDRAILSLDVAFEGTAANANYISYLGSPDDYAFESSEVTVQANTTDDHISRTEISGQQNPTVTRSSRAGSARKPIPCLNS